VLLPISEVSVAAAVSSTIGREIYDLIRDLYPLCRSITGNGLRQTMAILQQHIPLDVHEVPSGTPVFDWVIPREWNIRDAYLKDSTGNKVIDFQQSNLHVIGYSTPIHQTMSLDVLRPHLVTLPDRPDVIPYRTSYYRENWGFCLTHRQYLALKDGEYEVLIDSTLEEGSLTYGELYIPGAEATEVLISCHACHPSLCNDNLSAIGVATMVARELAAESRRLSYRFVFAPGTIGAITWLATHEEVVSRVRHGLVLAGVGDPGGFTYKRSRRGDAVIDRAAVHVLKQLGVPFQAIEFDPLGYDQRQYCSPGFDLPMGGLSRSAYGTYPEYHTSDDNLDFVQAEQLDESYRVLLGIIRTLEDNGTYLSLNPKCEPQLGRRGLYVSLFGVDEKALLWVLNQSDGTRDLLDIADRSGLDFGSIRDAARQLVVSALLRPLSASE
jgi:aminopeptidase-like protein